PTVPFASTVATSGTSTPCRSNCYRRTKSKPGSCSSLTYSASIAARGLPGGTNGVRASELRDHPDTHIGPPVGIKIDIRSSLVRADRQARRETLVRQIAVGHGYFHQVAAIGPYGAEERIDSIESVPG